MTEYSELIAEARSGDFEDRGWMIDVIGRLADALEAVAVVPEEPEPNIAIAIEILNLLPTPDEDARSGMIHARGLIAAWLIEKRVMP